MGRISFERTTSATGRMAWARPVALLLVALCGAACRRAPEHLHIALAEGYLPRSFQAGELIHEDQSGRRFLGGRGSEIWVELRIGSERWAPGPLEGTLAIRREFGQIGVPSDGSAPTRMVIDGIPARWIDPTWGASNPDLLEVGMFSSMGDSVVLWVGKDGSAPQEAWVSTYVSLGFADGDTWYARLIGMSGTGFVLMPSFRERFAVPSEQAGVLRFSLAAQNFVGTVDDSMPVELQVWLDEALLATVETQAAMIPDVTYAEIELPAGTRGRRIEFRFLGEGAVMAVFEPRMDFGSAHPIGQPQAPAQGQDLVIFLADTFRADNLMRYRGAPGGEPVALAPQLDQFAETGLIYTHAWAPASWTLPSHASLFSSLWPTQHGAGLDAFQLVSDAVTLAEVLREHGYRTFAITDGGFCSESLGLAQGFDLWLEGPRDLERTHKAFERFAEHDDGRPRCVFLQTYRTHDPYNVSAPTRELLGAQYDFPLEYEPAHLAMLEAYQAWKQGGKHQSQREAFEAATRRLAALYHGSVRDLDQDFARWLDSFERHRLGDLDDLLVFTSDHGEALGEHEFFGHWDGVWEEQTRIPLLVRNARLGSATIDAPVSLVDLAPTLTGWLGIDADPAWVGRRLDPGPSLETDLHLTAQRGVEGRTARIRGSRKLVRHPNDGVQWLFDLEHDPRELRGIESSYDVATPRPEWFSAHGVPERFAEPAPALVLDLENARALDRRQLDNLRELGYHEALEAQ